MHLSRLAHRFLIAASAACIAVGMGAGIACAYPADYPFGQPGTPDHPNGYDGYPGGHPSNPYAPNGGPGGDGWSDGDGGDGGDAAPGGHGGTGGRSGSDGGTGGDGGHGGDRPDHGAGHAGDGGDGGWGRTRGGDGGNGGAAVSPTDGDTVFAGRGGRGGHSDGDGGDGGRGGTLNGTGWAGAGGDGGQGGHPFGDAEARGGNGGDGGDAVAVGGAGGSGGNVGPATSSKPGAGGDGGRASGYTLLAKQLIPIGVGGDGGPGGNQRAAHAWMPGGFAIPADGGRRGRGTARDGDTGRLGHVFRPARGYIGSRIVGFASDDVRHELDKGHAGELDVVRAAFGLDTPGSFRWLAGGDQIYAEDGSIDLAGVLHPASLAADALVVLIEFRARGLDPRIEFRFDAADLPPDAFCVRVEDHPSEPDWRVLRVVARRHEQQPFGGPGDRFRLIVRDAEVRGLLIRADEG